MGMMAFEVMQEQKNGRCFSLLFSTNVSEEFHYTESKVRMRAKGNRERKRKHETRWASNGGMGITVSPSHCQWHGHSLDWVFERALSLRRSLRLCSTSTTRITHKSNICFYIYLYFLE